MNETTTKDNLKIGIVENDDYFLTELNERLEKLSNIRNIQSWTSSEQFLMDLDNLDLDILFLDIMLPGMSGIELVGKLTEKSSKTKVIMLTNMNSDEMIFDSIKNGALGYILKSDIGRIREIVEVVQEGGATITPTIALRVFSSFRKIQSNESQGLTDRETQILQLLVKGKKIASISQFLLLSEHTVNGYVKSIYKKLSVHNRVELTLKAQKLSLL
ncbi:response regulator transcription factor [Leptospira sp. GIMC2001]|uniref:response regulator transcription factor n=1 Tax=Leptospira sp. GIMC2001 TaxID=1513297 RepID=UPI00234B61AF|nr:response regulator transcription factor [Leptospira sp. GIMC2001]WCL47787.1 response regulator transcription factor [Leptospira sp. GIMC2001]